jgi:hypothetical protein
MTDLETQVEESDLEAQLDATDVAFIEGLVDLSAEDLVDVRVLIRVREEGERVLDYLETTNIPVIHSFDWRKVVPLYVFPPESSQFPGSKSIRGESATVSLGYTFFHRVYEILGVVSESPLKVVGWRMHNVLEQVAGHNITEFVFEITGRYKDISAVVRSSKRHANEETKVEHGQYILFLFVRGCQDSWRNVSGEAGQWRNEEMNPNGVL